MSGDRNNFFHEEPVRAARKAHVCALCREEIPPGASYVRVSRASCGERSSYAAHDACLAAALAAAPATPFRAESPRQPTGDFLSHV